MSAGQGAGRWGLAACCLGGCLSLACDRRDATASAAQADAGAAAGADAAAGPGAGESRIERDGLAISFALRAQAGSAGPPEAHGDATAVFTITDAATGAPARGLGPVGWMSRRAGAALDEVGCREKIRSYKAGLLSVIPEVDMNAYLLWTLNDDHTLSVINPQVAFSKTKLRSVVPLDAPGASFALHPSGDALFVTLPGARRVAVVDPRSSRVTANVPVGAAPMRVEVAPDGRTVWVGNDGDDTVSVLDGRSSQVVKTVRVGPGHHEIAFTDAGRTAWITSRDAETVAVVDTGDLALLAEVAIGAGAASVAASDAAGAVVVANEARGEVVVIDARRRAVASRVGAQRGVSAVRFDPGGRFAFALNPARDEVVVIDASTGQLAHTLEGFSAPDVVAFTAGFAYVRSAGANKVSLVDLGSLGRPGASPSVVDVQIGDKAPRAAGAAREPAQGAADGGWPGAPIAPLPEGGGAILASPADKMLYFYVEGMMAPIGTFQNHGREPGSALIEDRSLKEVEPGVYATTVRLGDAGAYDVELLLGSRKVAACLEANIAPSRTGAPEEGTGLRVELLFEDGAELEVGQPVTLRFRVQPKAPAAALEAKEVSAMIFRAPIGFRWTGPPRLEADGAFSVTFTPPRAGDYRFLLAAPGRGVPLGALLPLRLHAHEAAAPP